MKTAKKRGFTLVEAVVSVSLVAVGIASTLHALASLNRSDHLIIDRERMQRLAAQKYDVLLATGALTSASQTGDFKDRNIESLVWKADVAPSGVTNLDQIRLTVYDQEQNNGPTVEIDGLRYNPPATTTAIVTGAGG